MSWLHLRVDIMQEFYEQSLLGKRTNRIACLEVWLAAYEAWLRRVKASSYHNRTGWLTLARRRQVHAVVAPKCSWCGSAIPARATGPRNWSYCSRKCGARMAQSLQSARAELRRQRIFDANPCRHCGARISAASIRNPTARFCSQRCRNAENNRKRVSSPERMP